MASYHIYLKNQFPNTTGNYTLYRDTPFVHERGFGLPVRTFSNSFQTRNVLEGGVWPIDINDVPYAFCGTSPSEDLKPGDPIREDGHKLMKTVPGGNGSTGFVYNNNGRPAFRPEVSYNAPSGCFGVETENDFTSHHKFVAGFSGMDDDGKPRLWATFRINPAVSYIVRPNSKFYLGEFLSQPGTLIDHRGPAVEIDFDASPGFSNAIVTHMPDGRFDVKIVPTAVFAMETAIAAPAASAPNAQLTQLKNQAKLMSSLIDAALGISITTMPDGRYRCTAEWKNNPSFQDQMTVAFLLTKAMKKFFDYTWESQTLQPKLSIVYRNTNNYPVQVVSVHWTLSIKGLPAEYGQYVTKPGVAKIFSGPLLAAQPETYEFPADVGLLPQPQWRCSVDWLEGPPQDFREEIAQDLILSMNKRGYFNCSSENNENQFSVDFYHFEPTDLETTKVDWNDSYEEVVVGHYRMWVVNPQVKPLFHTQDGVTTNGSTEGIVVPSKDEFVGWLKWLEGPTEETKAEIIRLLEESLKSLGYSIGKSQNLPALKALIITFSHDHPHSLEQARANWLQAFNSIPIGLNNYITGPLCERNDPIKILEQGSSIKKYIGSLKWLEGPGEPARKSITRQLKVSLEDHDYQPTSVIDFGDESYLFIAFYHNEPSSLPEAKKAWQAAFDSIKGNQRNYITDPFCDEDHIIHLDPIEDPPNDTNVTQEAAPTSIQAGIVASEFVPEVEVISQRAVRQRNESLEEKKRRALELLKREGLVGVEGFSVN